jgi:GT2 family glycosyltransferase
MAVAERQRPGDGRVFAVMPVFNRLTYTQACLRCLAGQTYPFISIIVVDGGSTDGTVEIVGRNSPHVTVLSGQDLWWSGAMKRGIECALARGPHDDEFILMVNNDTVLPKDYVETLVRVSRREDAAVAAVIADADRPSEILEAGVTIRWDDYSLHVRRDLPVDGQSFFEVNVLPGRGTLLPIHMIRRVGNVAAARFPHYIADYELTHRMYRAGYRLGVTSETRLLSHRQTTGIASSTEAIGFVRVYRMLTDRRSMANLRDHLGFVASCAPPHLRARIRRQLFRGALGALLFQTEARFVARPLRRVVRPLRRLVRMLIGHYLISRTWLEQRHIDIPGLVQTGLLSEVYDGWFRIVRTACPPELRRVRQRLRLAAWNPVTKPKRWWQVRRVRRAAVTGL